MAIKLKDCVGCRDDFYNHNRMGLNEKDGVTRCWSFEKAELVAARDVPIHMPPPYLSLPQTKRPGCYKASGYVRVKPGALDTKGYWRS